MFDKPDVLDKIPHTFSAQRTVLAKQGPAFWDALCDGLPGNGTWWRMADAVAVLQRDFGFAKRTAHMYARAIIDYVRAESGSDVIQRKGLLYLFT